MKRNPQLFLADILESINKIEKYTQKISKERFFKDEKIQDAVIRRIEIIGEAAKNVSIDVRKQFPKIPWKKIAGTRDVLTHEYFGVKLERVWIIIKKDLPELKEKVLKMLEVLSGQTVLLKKK